ncbi:DsbA family protein [Pseudolysinimonas sp.]
MPPERLTKDQKREQAREYARIERDKRLKRETRNKILVRVGATVGVLALLAAIGGGVWLATRPEGPGPANMLSGGALFTGGDGEFQITETAGMPAGTDAVPNPDSAYPAPVRISTYIDFTCEFCKEFEVGNGSTTTGNGAYLKELVASGQATLEVFPVAILGDYSVLAANAASCVAAYQPESFFDMLDVMYRQQPDVENGGAPYSKSEILDLWRSVGIEPSGEVSACVNDERYSKWVEARTLAVTSDPELANPSTGGFGTPTIVVNGERYNAPAGQLGDPAALGAFIETVSTSGSGSGSTPSPTPTPTP